MSAAGKPHLWQGEWIDDDELEARLERLPEWVAASLGETLDTQALLEACERYSRALAERAPPYARLRDCLRESGAGSEAEADGAIQEMAAFLGRGSLERKLKRELGGVEPFLATRAQYEDAVFEGWAPLGFIVHVAPHNAFSVGPLSLIEGMLSGNLNFLKTSGDESLFPQFFVEGLLGLDRTEQLRRFGVVARIPSRRKAWLERLFAHADGIAAWGGEEAMDSIRRAAPSGVRVIEWGHKISLAYVAKEAIKRGHALEDLAREICLLEQQACSSPQCVYVETSEWNVLHAFAQRFADTLERVSKGIAGPRPEGPEQAEITLTTELARLESCLDSPRERTEVIEARDRSWRVLVSAKPGLQASPLFRSVWVKPLPRERILASLRPMGRYLQTAGLACDLRNLSELSRLLLRAGVVRVRRVGEMLGSYSGEPHDGVYALQRYCKRVSVQAGPQAQGISSFADLEAMRPPAWKAKPPLLDKTGFQSRKVSEEFAHLYFKSGGSTGEPKLSVFTYDDYHDQMRAGAEGLYAAGLDPLRDRCMNLFFGGGLYGGFLSFFTVLEHLHAVQFPMMAHAELEMVAETIVRNRVNVVLGMPSYLIQLFHRNHDALKKYGGVKKVFYGGEHFNEVQRKHFAREYGVELIRSAGYGSVDTGPLGYQCRHCEGSAHHLHQRLQYLEILKLDEDREVDPGEVGRLIFTSKARKGQSLERYELGDVGKWVPGECECGRNAPKFVLLGRSGDVFRIGSVFLNYQKFAQLLADHFDYSGELQITLEHGKVNELVTAHVARESALDLEAARKALLDGYKDLREAVADDGVLDLALAAVPSESFRRTQGSGKLIRIIDRRSR